MAISISPPQRPSGVARSTFANSSSVVSFGRDDRARRDGVDEDLIGRQLQRQRFGQRDDAGLRHVVRQVARIPRPAAARHPVREVDDAAAAQPPHVRHGRARAQPRRAQIHRHLLVPVVHVSSSNGRGRYIDAMLTRMSSRPERVDRLVDDPLAGVGLLQVGLEDQRAAAERRAPRRPSPPPRPARRAVDQRHVGARRAPARSRRPRRCACRP